MCKGDSWRLEPADGRSLLDLVIMANAIPLKLFRINSNYFDGVRAYIGIIRVKESKIYPC